MTDESTESILGFFASVGLLVLAVGLGVALWAFWEWVS